MDKTTNKILTTRFFESWWRRVQAWFVMTLATKKDLESINIDTTELAQESTSQKILDKIGNHVQATKEEEAEALTDLNNKLENI